MNCNSLLLKLSLICQMLVLMYHPLLRKIFKHVFLKIVFVPSLFLGVPYNNYAQSNKVLDSRVLNAAGTYYGILPCADCPGIATRLVLKKANQYVLITQYLQSDTKIDTTKGLFKWVGDVIELAGIKGYFSKFKIEKNKAIALDDKGKQVKGSLAKFMILSKIGDQRIEDKRLKLISLNGKVIRKSANAYYIILHSKEGSAESKVGCNQLQNPYILTANGKLYFKQGISTLMACPDMQIEEALIANLLNTHHYHLEKNVLRFYNKEQQALASFLLMPEVKNNWWMGKVFVQEGTNAYDPILGGAPFLKFDSKEMSSLKLGDIVIYAKTSVIDDTIVLEDCITGTHYVFAIVDNAFLVDAYGIKWKTKSKSK